MAQDDALITAENLSLLRDGRAILEQVSLTLTEGDFQTIIGPNGAGKTLLMKCLMGLETPTSGTVRLREGLRVGYVPQRFAPPANLPMTVERFLRLMPAWREPRRTTYREQVIEETGIAPLLAFPLHTLSGGEMQRVLLARALATNPHVLILDEPAQNLDITGQLAFYTLLETIHMRGNLSILMISHDVHLVMRSTRKVICLFHHICCEGAPHTVAQDPAFGAVFGQSVADMMAVYHHTHDHHHHGDSSEPCTHTEHHIAV
jgi:zinc transport system ATP-binding protein